MPLIITPGQLQRRSEFYLQLSSLISAGLTLLQALDAVLRSPPSRVIGKRAHLVKKQIDQGATFTEGLRRLDPDMPSFDCALIDAGEKSGRLDGCLKMLGDYYAMQAQLLRGIISDMAYPIFLIHFAVFITPFVDFFKTGNVLVYGLKTIGVLAPMYGVVIFYFWATQSTQPEKWRSMIENVLKRVPIVGTARRYLAMSRFAAALHALLEAGVLMIESLKLAADASGSPAVRRTIASWIPRLNSGAQPSELMRTSPIFPETFTSLYTTGEIAGKLHECLPRIQKYFHEESSRRLHDFCKWLPRGVYMIVAIAIGYNIIQGYSNMWKETSGLGLW